ncbi:MAG: hypothetical protein IKS49_04140 [Actinomycetaceae bacterium]|nr:hypothetical protein [Actinomycetaceae bacterium]
MSESTEAQAPTPAPPHAPADSEALLARLEQLETAQEEIECLEEILQALNTDLSKAQG